MSICPASMANIIFILTVVRMSMAAVIMTAVIKISVWFMKRIQKVMSIADSIW